MENLEKHCKKTLICYPLSKNTSGIKEAIEEYLTEIIHKDRIIVGSLVDIVNEIVEKVNKKNILFTPVMPISQEIKEKNNNSPRI